MASDLSLLLLKECHQEAAIHNILINLSSQIMTRCKSASFDLMAFEVPLEDNTKFKSACKSLELIFENEVKDILNIDCIYNSMITRLKDPSR